MILDHIKSYHTFLYCIIVCRFFELYLTRQITRSSHIKSEKHEVTKPALRQLRSIPAHHQIFALSTARENRYSELSRSPITFRTLCVSSSCFLQKSSAFTIAEIITSDHCERQTRHLHTTTHNEEKTVIQNSGT